MFMSSRVTEAKRNGNERKGIKDVLDDERSFDGRRVYPLLICVENLKSLDLRFLPKDRETLPDVGISVR